MTESGFSHNNSPSRRHVVVLGLMGIGKSTTAQALARALDTPCYDSDADLESVFGQTGGQLATRVGVDELHRLESAMLLGRLANHQASVLSAAASIVEDERCREALQRSAFVVVLHAPTEVVLERAATGDHRRVLPEAELISLTEQRAPFFAAVADIDLDATDSTDDLVNQIIESTAFSSRITDGD